LLASDNIQSVLVFLSVGAFNKGAVNTSVPASFKSDCCHPKVIFVGLDRVGNMGTCSVSLVPDIVSFGAKPNTTAVSLHNGETTKVPFTLTNLGSKGSFSFRVTKTSSLISYVIPFSLALDANASAAGHVIIASRNDTKKVEKLTVTAVTQSDTVNVKEVTLFVIQVSVLSDTQPTTPALKQIRLETVAPNNHQSIKPGGSLEVKFTVTNLATIENFTFNVSFCLNVGSSGYSLVAWPQYEINHLYKWPGMKTPSLPPFSLIRDFGKQNTRGNVSKISVSLTCNRHIGSKSTNHSPLA